jgi:putative hydrolase of the HAD superfamily
MIKAVIFDLDDTLISEKEYVKSGYRHVSKIIEQKFQIDQNLIYQDLMNLFKISSLKVFNRLFDKYNILYTNELILNLVNGYRGHLPTINFYDDVLPCLFGLKEFGIKLGMITDGYAIAQRQKLNALGAEKYFDEIVVTDELGREYWKPNPKGFEIIRDVFDVNFNEMIYIGDNPEKDFYINSIYPVKTIRIIREDSIYTNNYYLGTKENYTITSLHNFITIFQNV